MPNFTLLQLTEIIRSYGRGVVFYANRWDPGGDPISLAHLGDTEGDITINSNGTVEVLTLPELTGSAPHEADHTGDAPQVEIPLYLADPDLLPIISPTGSAHAGRTIRSSVAERTLAIFPEALFVEVDEDGVPRRRQLTFTGGVWQLNGQALDAAKETLLDSAIWFWRVYFDRPTRRYLGGAGDARRNIETASAVAMHHPDMPEGHALFTVGDPADHGIDLEGGS